MLMERNWLWIFFRRRLSMDIHVHVHVHVGDETMVVGGTCTYTCNSKFTYTVRRHCDGIDFFDGSRIIKHVGDSQQTKE